MTVTLSRSLSERLVRLLAEIYARMPDRCPHCGAHGPVPAFITGCDAWTCADWRCSRTFVAVD